MNQTDDLTQENRRLQRELKQWKRIATMAFTHAKGCLDGCRGACMCSCGYEHYNAQVRIESNEKCITEECENLTHLVLCDQCTDEQSGHWENQKEK